VDIYTRHVVKEDGPFFQAAIKSLSEEEKEDMLYAMQEFDLDFTMKHYDRMIEEKYAALLSPPANPNQP
jgi:hemerythrin-like domain-containing protein